jgi:DNA-binding IclR family transcriptional regulator
MPTQSPTAKRPGSAGAVAKRVSKSPPLPDKTATLSDHTAGSVGALTRLLQILDLFSLERTTIRVEEVVHAFGIVQSTAYRYLRELSDAGLLAQQGKGVYALGRRIVELERILQLSDPLLLAGKPVMDSLAKDAKDRSFLLCAYHRDGALCIYKVGPDDIPHAGSTMKIQRGRGTLLPLFTGAASHAILAYLPPHQLRSIYLARARDIAAANLGASWTEFRDHLSQIRKRGYAETLGKVNPGMHSIAVPVLREDGRVVGSLLTVGSAAREKAEAALQQVPLLIRKADQMQKALSVLDADAR